MKIESKFHARNFYIDVRDMSRQRASLSGWVLVGILDIKIRRLLSEVSSIIFRDFMCCRRFLYTHAEAASAFREDVFAALAKLRSQ